ncbi:MAG: spore coat protein YlbD [Bacilli bacterium]
MAKREEFKEFVKKNPQLVKFVKNGEMNWQKFYEIYDLYGDKEDAWKDYLTVATSTTAAVGLTDVVNWFKNINLDSVQTGVSNLQRVLGVFNDLGAKDTKKPTEEYKPRPVYKHFED